VFLHLKWLSIKAKGVQTEFAQVLGYDAISQKVIACVLRHLPCNPTFGDEIAHANSWMIVKGMSISRVFT
jgi:hypothetical protein